MKKRNKALIILATPFVIGFLLGFILGGGFAKKDKTSAAADQTETVEETKSVVTQAAEQPVDQYGDLYEVDGAQEDDVDGIGEAEGPREVIYYRNRLPYSSLFADMNETHLNVARSLGLSAIPQAREDVKKLKNLVEITDNEYYIVDDLKYSMPYLTKGAARELETIAKAFSDSLKSKNLLDYKLIVSSLLRTEEDVTRLKRSGNPNASSNSAHCYGTTFDITYTRYYSEDESEAFMQPFELTKVLGEVLLDQKNSSRCLVKYERKEHCFHITSCLAN